MTLRFYPILLSSVLLLLSACSTTGPVPEDKPPVGGGQAVETETRTFDLEREIRRDPAGRSLDDVIELSRRMPAYHPGLALAILRSLESIPSDQLTVMIASGLYDPEFSAWLDLSMQTRNLLISRAPVSAAAGKWADDHQGHVVTAADFVELMSSYRKLYPAPAQVAVLLPNEGGMAAAARAIRDGILSAYLDAPGNSVLRFYSSGETSAEALAAYLQARDDGATQIVGPLRSESASALASLADPGVPILLLNEPAEYKPTPPGQVTMVHNLALSQGEEASAIAQSALSQGQQRAIVIVPDSAWGTRIENAFTERFKQGNGQITDVVHFNPATEDSSAMLTRLLKIDESEQRKTELQTRLGITLNFEPVRRDDFDFIFLAASPQEGRGLKPLLRFHNAGDVPVYAMGRIYSGKVEPASDQDLNGIVFPITPWQLQTTGAGTQALESINAGSFGNLYALGQDAWNLLPWLPLLQKDTDLWYPGHVGQLRMQANGHLERQPAWAQFSEGRAVAHQWPVIR